MSFRPMKPQETFCIFNPDCSIVNIHPHFIFELLFVRFLGTFKVWVFFEKIDGFFGKNLNVLKFLKLSFAAEWVSENFFFKLSFLP